MHFSLVLSADRHVDIVSEHNLGRGDRDMCIKFLGHFLACEEECCWNLRSEYYTYRSSGARNIGQVW